MASESVPLIVEAIRKQPIRTLNILTVIVGGFAVLWTMQTQSATIRKELDETKVEQKANSAAIEGLRAKVTHNEAELAKALGEVKADLREINANILWLVRDRPGGNPHSLK